MIKYMLVIMLTYPEDPSRTYYLRSPELYPSATVCETNGAMVAAIAKADDISRNLNWSCVGVKENKGE